MIKLRKPQPPLKSIREFCIECCNGQRKEVARCSAGETGSPCSLWSLRFGRGVKDASPLKAIRAKCIDCCGGSLAKVRRCECTACSLHPYRMGRNPNLKGKRGRRSGTAGVSGTKHAVSP